MIHTHPDMPERELPAFSPMQQIKRRFFAMRNGELAAQLRAHRLNYRMNFGLNMPQIKDIAAQILAGSLAAPAVADAPATPEHLAALASELWANEGTRESRLLAPLLYPAELMTEPLATEWLLQAQTTEVADHLCHSLLRRLPFAPTMAMDTLSAAECTPALTPMQRYTLLRLSMNLLILNKLTIPEQLRTYAEASLADPLTAPVARQILDELDFLAE